MRTLTGSGAFLIVLFGSGIVFSVFNAVLLKRISLVCIVLLGLVGHKAWGATALPDGAINDPRYALGYLVATHYQGVDPTGVNDSTVGLQQAISDGRRHHLTVFLPSGTYTISDTLRAYFWDNQNSDGMNLGGYRIQGSIAGGSRPVIKLKGGALSLFDNTNLPRPMIAVRHFFSDIVPAPNPGAMPSHPLQNPAGYKDGQAGIMCGNFIRDVNFDTNSHSGAIGVTFSGAQNCSFINVKVQATNSFAGIYAIPGRNSVTANIEVTGGQYGIANGSGIVPGSIMRGNAGSQIVGVKLTGQTVAALIDEGSTPGNIVGFQIIKNTAGPAVRAPSGTSMVDGSIELLGAAVGSIAIDSFNDSSSLMRNIYTKGTNQLIKGGGTIGTGTGTWSRIEEYALNRQFNADGNSNPSVYPTYPAGSFKFESRSFVNGVFSATAIPLSSLENNSAAPPADLVSRHLWTKLPSFEDGPYVNIVSHGATPTYIVGNLANVPLTGNDDGPAIQAAIDAASAQGHGRVVIPRGVFHIKNTLVLHSNTVLIGGGYNVSGIYYHDDWKPTSEVYMIRTDDSTEATTFAGVFTLHTRSGPLAHAFISLLDWKAGRKSMIVGIYASAQWQPPQTPNQGRKFFRISGSGGGRHYGYHFNNDWVDAHTDERLLYVSGTTQPLAFYGQNLEHGKSVRTACPDSNMEIVNSSNVRVYGVKREGTAPTLIIRSSRNIALYSSGAMSGPSLQGKGFIQVYGNSAGILVGPVNPRDMAGNPNGSVMLHEEITGFPPIDVSPWPNMLSVYKRGNIDDSMFGADPGTTTYVLTVNTSGTGSGTVAKNPNTTSYASGSVVTLTATPANGSTFAGWSGAVTGTANPITVTMNGNKTVTATFNTVPAPTFTLSISTSGTGSGTVVKNPNAAGYASGTVVTLTATPISGSTFTGWSGAVTGPTNPLTVTMNANKAVTATFTKINQAPQIVSSAWADPSAITLPSTTTVNVLANDPDGDALTYTWSKVSGPGTVSFSPNATAASKTSTVNFSVAGTYTAAATVSDGKGGVATSSVVVNAIAATAIAINSGGAAAGAYSADTGFAGGKTYSTSSSVTTAGVNKPAPQSVYRTERYGNLTYVIGNLTAAESYTVRLHFAEIYWSAAGKRIFNVAINGQQVLTNLDIFAVAGGKFKAIVREFPAAADAAGKITIAYSTIKDNAKSSGIEVLSTATANIAAAALPEEAGLAEDATPGVIDLGSVKANERFKIKLDAPNDETKLRWTAVDRRALPKGVKASGGCVGGRTKTTGSFTFQLQIKTKEESTINTYLLTVEP